MLWCDFDGDGVLDTQYNGAGKLGEYLDYLGSGKFLNSYLVIKKDGEADIKVDLSDLGGKNYYSADFNNDGRREIIATNYSRIRSKGAIINPDGTKIYDNIRIMSWNEYNSIRSDLKLSTGGDGIPGWGDMIGSDKGSLLFGNFMNVDINGDGIPDMVSGSDGKYFLNLGNNIFVENTLPGAVVIRDFNGDGIADYIVVGNNTISVTINSSDGSAKTSELYKGNSIPKRVWCYDFDRDGDVDILAPIFVGNNAVLAFFENDGRGSFTMSENWIEDITDFGYCADFDSDGIYEIIGLHDKRELRLYKVPGNEINDEVSAVKYLKYDFVGDLNNETIFLNKDNSGRPLLAFGYSREEIYLSDRQNNRPSPPAKVNYHYIAGDQTLKLNWEAATDTETPSCDLTYELSIGTSDGSNDVVVAPALSDGRRRIVAQGSNGYNRHRTIDVSSWAAGKYYISVQAIDPNYQASQFSKSIVFEKTNPACRFAVDTRDLPGAGDTIKIQLIGGAEAGVEYDWDLDGAKILEQNKDRTNLVILYEKGGDKRLRLTAKGQKGVSTYVRTLSLTPVSLSQNPIGWIRWTGDLDCDGLDEIYYNKQFFDQDANGDFKLIKKLWNDNIEEKKLHTIDINHDGLPDIFQFRGSVGNYIITNMGNKNMVVGDEYNSDIPESVSFVDIDNDGYFEVLVSKGYWVGPSWTEIGKLSKDLTSVNMLEDGKLEFSVTQSIDVNGDGLIDFIGASDNKRYIYYNQGNYNFIQGEAVPQDSNGDYPALIADIDFDGKIDFIYNSSNYFYGVSTYDDELEIRFGNGKILSIPCPDGRPFSSMGGVFDFDNNGMADINVDIQNDPQIGGRSTAIIYLEPDYSVKIINYESTIGGLTSCIRVAHTKNGNVFVDSDLIRGIKNDRPQAPRNVRSTIEGDLVAIMWDAAKDTETPSSGLKYNVSIRHAGKDGEGAYVISPMNLGRDNVSVPFDHTLVTGTTFKIPLANLSSGDYEVKIQSVDGQMLTGAFSESYILTIDSSLSIEIPTDAIVNQPVPVAIRGNVTADKIDFGEDATVIYDDNEILKVQWSSIGLKTIKFDGKQYASVVVHDTTESAFTLPGEVMLGAEVKVECMTARRGEWKVSIEDNIPVPVTTDEILKDFTFGEDFVKFKVHTDQAFTLYHSLESGLGVTEKTAKVIVDGNCPEITMVTVNEGKYCINWETDNIPGNVASVKVYRETDRYNEYKLIGKVDVSEGKYTDSDSHPNAKSERYVISYDLPYGESMFSIAHKPILLQVNLANQGNINLRWNKYEGREVQTYVILGGNSKDNLEEIAQVRGNKTSFVDAAPRAFYTVNYMDNMGARSIPSYVGSNIVAASEAQTALLAESLQITGNGGSTSIDLYTDNTLQMRGILSPAGVSYNTLDWELLSGQEIATISTDGLITATDTGSIRVKATTRDGSNIEAETEIEVKRVERPLTWLEFKTWPTNHTLVVGEKFHYQVTYEPSNATEKPYFEIADPEIASVDQDGNVVALAPGSTYIEVKSLLNPEMFINLCIDVIHRPITSVTVLNAPENNRIKVGETYQYLVDYAPANATEKPYFLIYDPEIAEVDQDGNVTGIAPGRTVLVVGSLATDQILSHNYVEVYQPVTEIVLSHSEIKEDIGTRVHIDVTILPENASNKSWDWGYERIGTGNFAFERQENGGDLTIIGPGQIILYIYSRQNPEIRADILIEGIDPAGIDEVLADDKPFDVYNLQGILIHKQVGKEELETLVPDYYILRQGDKVVKVLVQP